MAPDHPHVHRPLRPRRWWGALAAGLVVVSAAALATATADGAGARPEAAASVAMPMSMAPGSMMMMQPFGHPTVVPAAQAGALAATVAPGATSAITAAAGAKNATVHHITLVLLATDKAKPDFTRTQALAGIALLRNFYQREMHGAITLTVDAAYDWQAVNFSCTDWYSTFQAGQRRARWVAGADKHLVIMLPTTVDCGYGGLGGEGATVDSGESLITVGPSLGYTAHELGHNLSLFHAGTLTCSSGSDGHWVDGAWSNGCRTEEYGDHYDVMGAAYYNFDFDAASLNRLGTLPNVYQVPATGAVQFRLAPISGAYTARRAATFVDASGVRYWIEARSTDGNAVFSPHPEAGDPDFPNGVRVIRSDPSEPGHNVTLSRPGDTSNSSQNFRVGETVTLDDGTTIRVVALDATGAVVRVVRGG